MRLIAFTVENFRRFVEPTSMKLHSDLIALIGPNEAGKSSVLRALSLLSSDDPFPRADEPRRSGARPQLTWTFQLEADDRDVLAEVPEAKSLRRIAVVKGPDGARRWTFHPSEPVRDRSGRFELADLIEDFLQLPGLDDVPHDSDDDVRDTLTAVLEKLRADVENFSSETVQMIALAGAHVETFDLGSASDETEDGGDEGGEVQRVLGKRRGELARSLNALARQESGRSPAEQAVAILEPRLPSLIIYTQEDRDLQGSYDLEEVADTPPPALQHLRDLAGLDLVAFRQEIRDGLRADRATRRDAANRTLREAFDKSWNQQKVALQIDIDGTVLFIHAIALDAPDAGVSDLSERSDGMRWFASLLAFVHGWDGRPILLVDEIETHLHYDAQADLINFLSRQEFTAKVIYTTHSLGCLPPDIGNGIRLVQPISQTKSQLVNGFWRNGVGFSPLLTSMGAAAVSFTPSRHAVIVEGPSDAVLLPTLLRQASEPEEGLGFQIVPGVAEVAAATASGLDAEAGCVVFLVDGDEGGLENQRKLIGGGIDAEKIVVLSTATGKSVEALETEDLIDAETYVRAVNRELNCWNDAPLEVTSSDLGVALRTKALKAWCRQNQLQVPDKVAVAEHVIEMSTTAAVFQPERQAFLGQLRTDLVGRLGIRRR